MVHSNETLDLRIIFEDIDLVVINKPAGLQVHGDGFHEAATVADWFLSKVPESKNVGESQRLQNGEVIMRPGIVHRLDRETSGVLILAKTQEAFEHLKAQFHDRHVQKEYRAFVYGTMKEERGTIDKKIGRSTRDYRLRSAEFGATGKLREAVTDWELIAQSGTHAYLKLFPKTGRTHQLRVHLKAVGRPIVGDRLYAPEQLLQGDNLGIAGLSLHAHTLTLTLPSGEMETFTAPIPESFEEAERRIAER